MAGWATSGRRRVSPTSAIAELAQHRDALRGADSVLAAVRSITVAVARRADNHLDVRSLELLEAALAGWTGALAVATHDRRLRTALALDREVALPRDAMLSR